VNKRENRPIVVDDAWPWYQVSKTRQHLLRTRVEEAGCLFLDEEEITSRAFKFLQENLNHGDLVVVPLMSGVLAIPALEQIAKTLPVEIVMAPVSKHPFVTLSADTESELWKTCQNYETLSNSLMNARPSGLAPEKPSRLVLLDTSTALGNDAHLFFNRVASWGWNTVEQSFLVLVDAVGDEDTLAPGSSREPKVRRPDESAVTSVGFDVLYTSHLRFLSLPETERTTRAATLRIDFPDLTRYWEDDAEDVKYVREALARTRAKSVDRTHARPSRSTSGLTELLMSVLEAVERHEPPRCDQTVLDRRRSYLRPRPPIV
jgi:hypothetical protein